MARGEGRGVVVWNDGGKGELEEGLSGVMEGVGRGSPWWWAWLLLGVPVLGGVVGAWEIFWGWWARGKWESEKRRDRAML